MTAHAHLVIEIACNSRDCFKYADDTVSPHHGASRGLRALRERMAQHGWTYERDGDVDLCPRHAAGVTARPVGCEVAL